MTTSKHRMSGRERIMAALKMQPVDRLPFVPLIGPYTLKDMPPEIAGEPGRGFDPDRMANACRQLGCDLMIRHVPATEPFRSGAIHLQMLGAFEDPVTAKMEFKDGKLWEILETPVGVISGSWQFSDKAGIIPHAVQHAVNDYEQLKIFQYAVEHLRKKQPAVDNEAFLGYDRSIGDDGIATASISNSPLMFLIEMAWGLENTYYMLQDHPDEVEDILSKLHAQALAESAAEVVIQYENTSSTLLSPAIFRKYCLPYLNEYADILKSAGKLHIIHMCGTLDKMTDDINTARFDGIVDITPHPTGDLPLEDAAERLSGKVVAGGIDPNTFISRNAEFVEQTVSETIRNIKSYKGVLLGSADVTPRGTLPENIHLIARLVESFGSYDE